MLISSWDWNKIGAIATVVGLGAGLLGFLWRIASIFQGMRLSLHTIATNDLPHIYGEIRDMRKDFLDYIKDDIEHHPKNEETRGQDSSSNTRGD